MKTKQVRALLAQGIFVLAIAVTPAQSVSAGGHDATRADPPLYKNYDWMRSKTIRDDRRDVPAHMVRHLRFASVHSTKGGRMVCTPSGSGSLSSCRVR